MLAIADNGNKTDLSKIFAKNKLKHSSAVMVRTVYSNLSAIDVKSYDMLVFYSPSDIKALRDNFPDVDHKTVQFATYGQTTLKALKAAKLNPTIIAPTPEAPSIAKALSIYFEQK